MANASFDRSPEQLGRELQPGPAGNGVPVHAPHLPGDHRRFTFPRRGYLYFLYYPLIFKDVKIDFMDQYQAWGSAAHSLARPVPIPGLPFDKRQSPPGRRPFSPEIDPVR